MPTLFEAKEQEMCHVNQGRHRKGEIKQYFWTNNRLKGQREKNSFNIEAFVALNVILCCVPIKMPKKCSGMVNTGYICFEFLSPGVIMF